MSVHSPSPVLSQGTKSRLAFAAGSCCWLALSILPGRVWSQAPPAKPDPAHPAKAEGATELTRADDLAALQRRGPDKLAKRQGDIANRTGDLGKKIQENEERSKAAEGKPNEGKPNEGKPNEGKPNEGKPNEGKPNEGKPNEGKPNEGKPNEGKPN